jgi:hypothetical protein
MIFSVHRVLAVHSDDRVRFRVWIRVRARVWARWGLDWGYRYIFIKVKWLCFACRVRITWYTIFWACELVPPSFHSWLGASFHSWLGASFHSQLSVVPLQIERRSTPNWASFHYWLGVVPASFHSWLGIANYISITPVISHVVVLICKPISIDTHLM